MASVKPRKKRILANGETYLRNVAVRSGLKTAVYTAHGAIAADDKAVTEVAYRAAAQKLDRAAGAGVTHKNQATNRKSGLAVAINAP